MAKRLVRAKEKIRNARVPFRVPAPALRAERLPGVLAVMYLLFNEGYSASAGDDMMRHQLCDEAVRLGRVLNALTPDYPEVPGPLALMLLQRSRRHARTDPGGDIVTLADQDRSLWDAGDIEEALTCLAKCPATSLGPYQLQAEMAACHGRALNPDKTDWARIAALYGQLRDLNDSAIIWLNQAAIISMSEGPEPALALVTEIERSRELAGYHLLPAMHADLLRRLDRNAEARVYYERALELAGSEPEKRFLAKRLAGG